jgi:hypothetical protein
MTPGGCAQDAVCGSGPGSAPAAAMRFSAAVAIRSATSATGRFVVSI